MDVRQAATYLRHLEEEAEARRGLTGVGTWAIEVSIGG